MSTAALLFVLEVFHTATPLATTFDAQPDFERRIRELQSTSVLGTSASAPRMPNSGARSSVKWRPLELGGDATSRQRHDVTSAMQPVLNATDAANAPNPSVPFSRPGAPAPAPVPAPVPAPGSVPSSAPGSASSAVPAVPSPSSGAGEGAAPPVGRAVYMSYYGLSVGLPVAVAVGAFVLCVDIATTSYLTAISFACAAVIVTLLCIAATVNQCGVRCCWHLELSPALQEAMRMYAFVLAVWVAKLAFALVPNGSVRTVIVAAHGLARHATMGGAAGEFLLAWLLGALWCLGGYVFITDTLGWYQTVLAVWGGVPRVCKSFSRERQLKPPLSNSLGLGNVWTRDAHRALREGIEQKLVPPAVFFAADRLRLVNETLKLIVEEVRARASTLPPPLLVAQCPTHCVCVTTVSRRRSCTVNASSTPSNARSCYPIRSAAPALWASWAPRRRAGCNSSLARCMTHGCGGRAAPCARLGTQHWCLPTTR